LTFLKRNSAISLAMQHLGETSGAAVFIMRSEGEVR